MGFKRIDYQIEAIENLIIATENLFRKGQASPVIAFKAPTGSGKTIITAKYIQNICTRFEDDICFVWLSIGKGGIHIQSKEKLDDIFQGFPEASLLNEEYFGSKNEISKNEVVVVNWESINNKDDKGNYTNVLMRDGEKVNFRQVLSNTRAIGRKIILIIDESHYSATTDRAKEIREEIKPNIVLEMSATPKLMPTAEDIEDGKGAFVRVKIEDVINEEMIKKEIIINEGIESINEDILDRRLLEITYQKRLKLKELLENEEESDINPLVIIQLPNAEEGEEKRNSVIDFLKEKDITIENGKVAYWMDGYDKPENISKNTNPIEFLLFKQAIDTGWDCPRAQILLRFREVQSFIFEKQTLGRILRMPEQAYYKSDELNKAYIYTDYMGNILNIIDRDFDFPNNDIKNHPLIKREEYDDVNLLKEYKFRKKNSLKTKLAKDIFINWAEDKGLQNGKYQENKEILLKEGFDFDTSKLTQDIISTVEIKAEKLLSDETEFEGDILDVEIDEERTELIFRRILRKKSTTLGNNRETMYQLLRERIYELFFNYVLNFTEVDNLIINTQKLFILNYDFNNNNFFNKLIDDIVNTYKNLNEDDLYDTRTETISNFVIPNKISINTETHELVNIDKYYYNECYLQKDRSNPEKDFEDFIKSNLDKIKFWVKNRDYGMEYFCMVYELDESKYEFYPDYIIKFNDGRIGIFEAKKDEDGSDKTIKKAERLYKYIQEENRKGKNLFGGIVANYGTDSIYIKIHNKENYTTNFNEWIDLETLI